MRKILSAGASVIFILTLSSCLKDKDSCKDKRLCIKNLTGDDRYVLVNEMGFEILDSVGHCWELYHDVNSAKVEWSKVQGQFISAEINTEKCFTEFTIY